MAFYTLLHEIEKQIQFQELTPWSKVFEKLSKSAVFPPFMEPESSLSCSQEHSTGTYPKPD